MLTKTRARMKKWIFAGVAAAALSGIYSEPAKALAGTAKVLQTPWIKTAAGSCKQVSSCEEAVELWCGGYRRADGDGDGIPCENVCSSVEEVEQIRVRLGC